MSALKKTGKWALFIVTPTVILIIVLVGIWAWKKYKLKSGKPTGINTGMNNGMNYRIEIPLSYQQSLFTNGQFFDAIGKVNYSFIDEGVENNMIFVNVLLKPEDFTSMKDILDGLKSEITIKEIKNA